MASKEPFVSTNPRKDDLIKVRVATEEKAVLQARADAAGVKLSEYVRTQLLGPRPPEAVVADSARSQRESRQIPDRNGDVKLSPEFKERVEALAPSLVSTTGSRRAAERAARIQALRELT